ncbi:MAG TPA: M50 family metallopeptidase, partial [Propionibacteriaceae bacterium]
MIAEVLRRVTAVQPPPAPVVVALAAAIAAALVLPRAVWPYTRMLVTITHEGAHGVAAFVTGRRLQGIRLHSDTSGLTV